MESNEFLNFVDCVLEEWTGKAYSFDGIEQYATEFPSKSVIVDIFPSIIADVDKYYQVSVFYRKWVDGEISKTTFLRHENNYVNFVKELWLYNTVDICYDLSFSNYFKKGEKRLKLFSKGKSTKAVKRDVKDWNTIEEVVRLALREAGFLWMYCKQLEMVVVVCDFSIQLLTKEEQSIQTICPTVVGNSLFMRPINKMD